MSEKDPTENPVQWFGHFCLVALLGTVALTVAVDLLAQIWPWIVLIGVVVLVIAIAVALYKKWRQPW